MATRFVIRKGDITNEICDFIVNAANTGLRGGGGVDGAIHDAGGPMIMAECDAIRAERGGCPTGEAVLTTAGDLKARHVIHTVGPVWYGGHRAEELKLAAAYRSSLALAAKHQGGSISFPSISTGVYGYPIKAAAPIALAAARDFVAASPDDFTEIRFVLFSDEDLAAYCRSAKKLKIQFEE